jgi:hypothetical protein
MSEKLDQVIKKARRRGAVSRYNNTGSMLAIEVTDKA